MVEPPSTNKDIIVSKYDESSLQILQEALRDHKRYGKRLTTRYHIMKEQDSRRVKRVIEGFGSRILCKDCGYKECSILQPFAYKRPKKIQCNDYNYVYYQIHGT